MTEFGVGLIGTVSMGKAHAVDYGAVRAVMGDVPDVRRVALAETPLDKAQSMAAQFGFDRATADWRNMLADPAIHFVSITTPKWHAPRDGNGGLGCGQACVVRKAEGTDAGRCPPDAGGGAPLG